MVKGITINGTWGNDRLFGTVNDDALFGSGGRDLVIGYEGNDDLRGGYGSDTIRGAAGNDTVNGGIGSDILHGGAGNDILRGGPGSDFLEGGTGDDVMTGNWTPGADDLMKGRLPGFGMTINIINGGLECGQPNNPKVEDRVGFYGRYAGLLAVDLRTAHGRAHLPGQRVVRP